MEPNSFGRVETIITSVRPIRKLFVLNESDIDCFISIIRLLSQEIAGITNIILPAGADIFEENRARLVAQYDPDIVVNYSEISSALLENHFHTRTFTKPDIDEVRRMASTSPDTWDNLPVPFASELQPGGSERYALLLEDEEVPDLFVALHYGAISRDYRENLEFSIFNSCAFLDIGRDAVIAKLHDHEHNFNYLTLGLSMSYGGGSSLYEADNNPRKFFSQKPTIILGSYKSLRSMLYFWNTRASYPFNQTLWLPVELLEEIDPDLSTYTYIAVADPHLEQHPKVQPLYTGRNVVDCSQYYFPLYTNIWTSFEHASATTILNGVASVHHPAEKLFSRSGLNMNVALGVRGLDETVAPRSSAAGELFFKSAKDPNPLGFSRIGPHGLATRIRQFDFLHSSPLNKRITIPEDLAVIENIFSERGFSTDKAPAGDTVEQLKKLFGNPDNLDLLTSEQALALLVTLAPKRVKRIVDAIKESGLHLKQNSAKDLARHLAKIPALGRPHVMTLSQIEGRLNVRRDDKKKLHALVQVLYDKGMILRGKSLECRHCHTMLWYLLESLSRPLLCYACNSRIELPIAPESVSDDSYRLNELLVQAVDQGLISVLLTMRAIGKQRSLGIRSFASLVVKRVEGAEEPTEIDIVFTIGSTLGVCEVKSDQDFDLEQADRLLDIAASLKADVVLFSTLKGKSSEAISVLEKHLLSKDQAIPVLIFSREALMSAAAPRLADFYKAAVLQEDRGRVFLV